jgi:hypothetical protein
MSDRSLTLFTTELSASKIRLRFAITSLDPPRACSSALILVLSLIPAPRQILQTASTAGT